MWNNRVWKETLYECGSEEVLYTVRETYYNKDDEVCACNEGSKVQGYSIEELKENLERFLRALEHPVLDADTIVFAEMSVGW